MSDVREEFTVHLLKDIGVEKAIELGLAFSELLAKVEAIVPAGRERALVITKLQEACFFAKRGMALQPDNHSGQTR